MFSIDFSSIYKTMEKLYKASYDAGFYTNETIAGFVKNGSLDKAGYERITGEPYEEATK